MRSHNLLLLLPLLLLITSSLITCVISRHVADRSLLQTGNLSCPLDFTILNKLGQNSRRQRFDNSTQCQYIRQGIRLVQSEYLRVTNSFLPPLASAESCWAAYQIVLNTFIPNFDVRRTCGFQTSWIAQGCINITTRAQFENSVPPSVLDNALATCNQSLENSSPCATCTTSLSSLQASYLTGRSIGNVTTCADYPVIYTAAVTNTTTDPGTSTCLFSLDFSTPKSKKKNKAVLISVLVICILFSGLAVFGYLFYKRKKERKLKEKLKIESNLAISGLDSFSGSTNLVKFSFEDIKAATKNFSRHNIIGRGGYGNVYKGVLLDGSEVALKRFKNCSAAGDSSFTHEVEVIASVRHVNLVALRGYCVATTQYEGHQRIIVCDLMTNGSIHDHLFEGDAKNLSWPIRQKIALGTAKGLAYLHYGAQPAIIHRDIKASNILLDECFEPKVADFGLAKFTPEGMTHLSTRVAGTMGYVAPEYALYGQLTERSDVYSFGIVLLEILSGKKSLMAVENGQPTLLSDWAWSLVREGRILDVVDENMPELGPADDMEKYILIALLCAHPQLYARPTMDQVVKMLDTDIPVPTIPDWPLPLTAGIADIEKSASNFNSGNLSTASGYQPYTPRGYNEKNSLF